MDNPVCARCGGAVIPLSEENATYLSNCHHFYHHRCLFDMMIGKTEKNARNQILTPCADRMCTRKISMSDVAQIRRSNQLDPPIPSRDLRVNLQYREDQLAIFAHRLALMTVENRDMRNRYLMTFHHYNTENAVNQRNPATLYKPRSNLTNDFVRCRSNRFPSPRIPNDQILHLRTRAIFHREQLPNGNPIIVKTSTFRSPTELLSTAPPIAPSSNIQDRLPKKTRLSSKIPEERKKVEENHAKACPESKFKQKGPSTLPVHRTLERISPPKQIKGTSAHKGGYHRRYRLRWNTSSTQLAPFYPLNSYPRYFTAAGYEHEPDVFRSVYFAFDILLVGDGHMEAIARILELDRPFEGILDRDMYQRDLLLAELVAYLGSYEVLPSRIMISIGHSDILTRTPYDEFTESLCQLSLILKNANVREILIVPLIPHPSFNLQIFRIINDALEHNWTAGYGGITMRLERMFSGIHARRAHFDHMGPYYDVDDYTEVISALCDRFIPPLKKKAAIEPDTEPIVNDNDEQSEAIQNMVETFKNSTSQPSTSQSLESTMDAATVISSTTEEDNKMDTTEPVTTKEQTINETPLPTNSSITSQPSAIEMKKKKPIRINALVQSLNVAKEYLALKKKAEKRKIAEIEVAEAKLAKLSVESPLHAAEIYQILHPESTPAISDDQYARKLFEEINNGLIAPVETITINSENEKENDEDFDEDIFSQTSAVEFESSDDNDNKEERNTDQQRQKES